MKNINDFETKKKRKFGKDKRDILKMRRKWELNPCERIHKNKREDDFEEDDDGIEPFDPWGDDIDLEEGDKK